jgi:hypothetical protein
MNQIKTIKNFISLEDASLIIDYIDKNYKSFFSDKAGTSFKKFFGLDDIYKSGNAEPIIDGLDNIKELSVRIVEDTKDLLSKEFDDDEPILLNSFWFVRHLAGDTVVGHADTEDGHDPQFVYSAILYLNTLEKGGNLDFPLLGLSFKPNAGDLIIFPSSGEKMFHEVKSIGQDRYTVPMWFTKDKSLELKFK